MMHADLIDEQDLLGQLRSLLTCRVTPSKPARRWCAA